MSQSIETQPTTTATHVVSAATRALVDSFHRAGAYQRVEWTTAPKPAAAHKGTVPLKRTRAVVRTGIDYSHLGVNTDVETGPLQWGQWVEFPYIIVHNGQEYIRLYVDRILSTTYYVDGVETDRDSYEEKLTPSKRQQYIVSCETCGTALHDGTVDRKRAQALSKDHDSDHAVMIAAQHPNGGTITPKAANVRILPKD